MIHLSPDSADPCGWYQYHHLHLHDLALGDVLMTCGCFCVHGLIQHKPSWKHNAKRATFAGKVRPRSVRHFLAQFPEFWTGQGSNPRSPSVVRLSTNWANQSAIIILIPTLKCHKLHFCMAFFLAGQSFPLSLCGPNSITRANAHIVYG